MRINRHPWTRDVKAGGRTEPATPPTGSAGTSRPPARQRLASDGIAPLGEVRHAMIELRNSALDRLPDGANEAVLLSHAIWWLSTIDEEHE